MTYEVLMNGRAVGRLETDLEPSELQRAIANGRAVIRVAGVVPVAVAIAPVTPEEESVIALHVPEDVAPGWSEAEDRAFGDIYGEGR